MLDNWTGFLMGTGNSNIFALKTVFSRSSVSQPIYPRYGSEFSLSLTLTPPYSLFDKKDYKTLSALAKSTDSAVSKAAQTDLYSWVEYHKWQFKARMFHPITSDQKLVLMMRAEMGYLGHYNKYKLSPFEAFRVGGDGMSGYTLYGEDIIGLRGYKDGELVPIESQQIGDKARAYTKYTMEVRYPLILQPKSTIYGLVFVEGGNGYSSWKKFNPFNIKRSAGAGVRIFLPIVGMLGFDWAWGFDKPAGGTERSGSQIHFIIGTEF
jgi:outer membrane protein insertion porin family